MKIIAVGDLHGKDYWKRIDIEEYDRIIFIGDYVDSFRASDKDIYKNLENLKKLKQENIDKVILLLGNHDEQYLRYPECRCTGFRQNTQKELTAFFRYHKDLFQAAYQIKNYIFTHAGISNSWLNWFKGIIKKEGAKFRKNNIANILNSTEKSLASWRHLHTVGPVRGGDSFGGITWADKSETEYNFISGFHQIVGHTPIDDIVTKEDKNSSITYIDVLDKKIRFYEAEI